MTLDDASFVNSWILNLGHMIALQLNSVDWMLTSILMWLIIKMILSRSISLLSLVEYILEEFLMLYRFRLCTPQMKNLTKEEFVHILRRQSTGFSRGSSKYRGVTLHKCGRWEARMGQFLGKK